MPALLSLDMAPRAAVWNKLIEIIRIDGTVKRVIPRAASFRYWTGTDEDSQPFTTDLAPAVRFTPAAGPVAWLYPGSMAGDLLINCEMIVQGTAVIDVMNLWWAIQRALYPRSQPARQAIQVALNAAGGTTGQPVFSQPAYSTELTDNCQLAVGQIKIQIMENIDT